LGEILFAIGMLYGEFGAIRLFFFDLQVCSIGGECEWFFANWAVPLWGAIFLLYLLVSPIVGIFFGWPAYIAGAVLLGLASAGKKSTNPQPS